MREREALFQALLREGERLVGEWLAQAHGTRYALTHEPWVVFDLMSAEKRAPDAELREWVADELPMPRVLHAGGPFSVEEMLAILEPSMHGALDPVEGAVWRVERRGAFDFLAKWVRPEKVDGRFLPEVSGEEAIWNWQPRG